MRVPIDQESKPKTSTDYSSLSPLATRGAPLSLSPPLSNSSPVTGYGAELLESLDEAESSFNNHHNHNHIHIHNGRATHPGAGSPSPSGSGSDTSSRSQPRMQGQLRSRNKLSRPTTTPLPIPSLDQSVRQTRASLRTPPRDTSGALREAFHLIWAHSRGQLPNRRDLEWHEIQLKPTEHETLRANLKRAGILKHFEESISYDYCPKRSVLALRLMPSTLHESVISELYIYLRRNLDQLANSDKGTQNPVIADLISDIASLEHATITLYEHDDDKGSNFDRRSDGTHSHGATNDKRKACMKTLRSPDIQFCFALTSQSKEHRKGRLYTYDNPYFPQFIIEVGFSQSTSSLQKLAKEYYENSDGNIKTVLTFKIEYLDNASITKGNGQNPSSTSAGGASFCLYRGPERIHKDEKFRDSDGQYVDCSALELRLSDFVPDEVLAQLESIPRAKIEQTTIDLSPAQLHAIVAQAQDKHRARENAKYHQEQSAAQQEASGSSKKRKTVHWDESSEEDEADGDQDPTQHQSDYTQSIRSKRQRLSKRPDDSAYRPPVTPKQHRVGSNNSDNSLPHRRRQTRSMSRSGTEHE